jgi:hypothetical protein
MPIFCGRTDELTEVLELLGADNAQSVSIVADPGFGRTVFLSHLATVAAEQLAGEVVLLRLRGDEGGPVGFCRVFAAALPERYRTAPEQPETFVREAISAVASAGRRLILLCDDFHHITKDPVYPPSFFESLRSLASTEERFAIVTSSFLPLNEMCSSVELAGSPFFNIFSMRRLGPLKRAGADELLDALARSICEQPAEEDLRVAVWDLAGGCPQLVRLAADHFLVPGVPSSAAGDDQAWGKALQGFLDDAGGYYDGIWALLSEREQKLCLAATDEKNQPRMVPVSLNARGLLAPRGRSGSHVPSCFAFKRYLLRRQGKDVAFVHPRRRGLLGFLRMGWRGRGSAEP